MVEEREDVIFVCHSLGCMIAYDFMKHRGTNKVDRFITMGCNIPMFLIGSRDIFIPKLEFRKWANFIEPNDILSMPIKALGVFMSASRMVILSNAVDDIRFDSKHVFKSSNIASHNVYWRSNDLISRVKKILST